MVKALVKGSLLVWARKSAGLTTAQVATKLKTSNETIEQWEADESKPSIGQLRKLSEIYKRPLAVFYLQEPPLDFQAMRDFRRRGDENTPELSPKLRYEIRQAEERREAAMELLDALEETAEPFSATAFLANDPEATAQTVRDFLGVKFSDQLHWKKNPYDSFNNWKQAIEQAGLLVFQATDIDPQEAAGFSLKHKTLPVIAVNIKDSPNARTFTLLHEFTHVMLHQNSLCNELGREGKRDRDSEKIEVFCNHVAGAILIPKHLLLQEQIVSQHPPSPEWEESSLEWLGSRFGTSKETVLRRLLIVGRTNKDFYRTKREQYQKEWEETQKKKDKGGFAPPHQMAISSGGRKFLDIVLRSYYRKKITLSDVSSLIGVRLKHLPKIERAILGRPVTAVHGS
ncbi:MAG: ImmA/IrrE family metallo-endopeptidase [Nitrospira sp.]|nr:ImmA/IrrE family metallo-endopeptidase [Nitrospira sp.]